RKIYFASLVGKVHLHLPFLKNLVSFPLARAQNSDRGQVELLMDCFRRQKPRFFSKRALWKAKQT
ncbi:MAG: hypothetical protein K1000chlam2_01829, partial [Chlamydiae bacterium]|nr:hypothetical protein [Chlamydiota bacterium]